MFGEDYYSCDLECGKWYPVKDVVKALRQDAYDYLVYDSESQAASVCRIESGTQVGRQWTNEGYTWFGEEAPEWNADTQWVMLIPKAPA